VDVDLDRVCVAAGYFADLDRALRILPRIEPELPRFAP
jgi:hypothetical protein